MDVNIRNEVCKMNEKLKEIVLLAMKAEYDCEVIKKIQILLEDFFETKDIKLIDNKVKVKGVNDQKTIYIPIYINDTLYYFYEVKNFQNKFGIVVLDMLSSVFSQMYTNIIVNNPNTLKEEIDLSTNVYNRNAFEKFKKRYIYTDFASIGCVFVDINCMNEINNEYGHQYGDKVILNVATILKDTFENGKVFRIGGDEFVVFVTNLDEQMIRQKTNFAKEILENNKIFISYGISYGNNILDIERLIDEADQQMFEKKNDFYQKKGKSLRKKYHK